MTLQQVVPDKDTRRSIPLPRQLSSRQQQLLPRVEELWCQGLSHNAIRLQLRCSKLTVRKLVRYLMAHRYGVIVTYQKDWLVHEVQKLERLEREAVSAWECLRERDLVTARGYLEIQHNCIRDRTKLLAMLGEGAPEPAGVGSS